MIIRRVLWALSIVLCVAAFVAYAQQPQKVHRVAYIASISPASTLAAMPGPRDLLRGLRSLGYVEGKNLVMEWRSAEGRLERFPEIVRELIALKVDIIVTVGNSMTRTAKEVTQTVPIVMAASGSPVESGLVQSLARPGGNITGLSIDAGPGIVGKRLQLLKEIYPKMARVAYLASKAERGRAREVQNAEAAARELGVRLLFAEHTPTQYADAFALIARERVDALFPANTIDNFANRRLIVDFATRNRLAGVYPVREYAEAGGLIAYGVDSSDLLCRAAGYVDRILKGAKPADLPIERPTKFELVINMKTAKALGLTIPESILLRADRVIE